MRVYAYRALGNNRSEAHISKRVRYLNLHMKMADRDSDAEERKDKLDGVVEDRDHSNDANDDDDDAGPVPAIRDPTTIVPSSVGDANRTHIHHPTTGSQRSSSGWDNDDGEDPRKIALFKNSVLSRLNMDDYDDDDDDDATNDQRDKGGVTMKKGKMMDEVSAKMMMMKKKKGLIGRRLQSKVGGMGSHDDDSDQSFDDDDDSAMVVVVPDSVVLQAGLNKKRQLIIDSDDEEEG